MDKNDLKNKMIEQYSSFNDDVKYKLEELSGEDDFNKNDDYVSSVEMLTSDEYKEFFEDDTSSDDGFINIPNYPNVDTQTSPKKLTMVDKIAQLRGVSISDEYVRKK